MALGRVIAARLVEFTALLFAVGGLAAAFVVTVPTSTAMAWRRGTQRTPDKSERDKYSVDKAVRGLSSQTDLISRLRLCTAYASEYFI